MNAQMTKLKEMRDFGGAVRTPGLADARIESEAARHPELVEAIEAAHAAHVALRKDMADLLRMDETEQVAAVQADFVNFYPEDGVNPYVALAARGPWVVTLKGAVVHDSGGYGMLGFGHTPKAVLDAMARPQVMANVMTPNVAQLRFAPCAEARARPHARRLAVRAVPVPQLGFRSRLAGLRASPTSTPS